MKKIAMIILSLVLMLSLTSCLTISDRTSSNNSVSSEESSESSSPVGKADLPYTVEGERLKITLESVTESNGSDFMTPDKGNIFVLCKIEIENISDQEETIDPVLCFDAYADDYSISRSISAEVASDEKTLDGTIAPGKKLSGVLGYEVDKDWNTLEIRFTANPFLAKETVFVYAK